MAVPETEHRERSAIKFHLAVRGLVGCFSPQCLKRFVGENLSHEWTLWRELTSKRRFRFHVGGFDNPGDAHAEIKDRCVPACLARSYVFSPLLWKMLGLLGCDEIRTTVVTHIA
jgi:hypothetical protein